LGPESVRNRGIYGIVSAQEYRSQDYGHICLLMHDKLPLEGAKVNPNNWPVFGQVSQMIREHGGYAFHAHGGASKEIYADYVQGTTDGVELLQMAHYRGIGLEGWYRILNIGFRFPGVAGSDFPYVRALGDCRTYVYSEERPSFSTWARRAAEGRSFFTSGPLLLLEVNGKRPGDIIDFEDGLPQPVSVQLKVRSEVTPVQYLELILNGKTFERWTLPSGSENLGVWHQRQVDLGIEKPSWIAARAYGVSATGRSDAEAHTNPVYMYHQGRKPFQATDVDWLAEKLEGQISKLSQRTFPEKAQALEFFNESRRQLLDLEQ
ncbi:MAG: CehA/McbA family metallohydrolase, partial [Verrucomicrobia bacterium]|nr:CehA/McbA family metallohydrolase [Verrucomicrobiota bacterium]